MISSGRVNGSDFLHYQPEFAERGECEAHVFWQWVLKIFNHVFGAFLALFFTVARNWENRWVMDWFDWAIEGIQTVQTSAFSATSITCSNEVAQQTLTKHTCPTPHEQWLVSIQELGSGI